MTPKKPVNMAASVRQRLLDKPRTDKRPFNELLQYFAMERFLYRLSRSPQVDKFVLKGALNSRMKDFYDIWLLARQFNFDGQQLQEAISETLNNRGTSITGEVTAFSNDFVQNKSSQWKAFRNKLKINTIPSKFADVVVLLREFIVPITEKIKSDASATDTWIAPGPWQ